MSERYGKLFLLPKNVYAAGSPVILAAGALLKDNQTGKVLAQLKFRSISIKKIKALTVCIQPLDTVGNPLGDTVAYQYLDLCADRDSKFGQKTPTMLPNQATRSFHVSVTEVIFADNTIWHGDNQPWETLKKAQMLSSLQDSELEKQFRLDYGTNCTNLLLEQKDLWHCVCGSVNRQNENYCHMCGKSYANLQAIDMEALRGRKAERLAKEQEQSKEKGTKLSKAIKVVKKVAIAAIAVLVAIPVIALCNPYNWKTVLVSETYVPSGGNATSVTEYQYDLHGRMKETIYDYSFSYEMVDLSSHTMKIIDRYSYDNRNNITKVDHTLFETYENGKSFTNHCLYINEYDESGNLIEENTIYDSGRLSELTYFYEYDDFGECICQKQQLDDGDVSIVYTYENSYDEQGRLIQKICTKNSDSTTESTEYAYNTSGQLIKETHNGRETIYEYNDAGRLIRKVYASNGEKGSETIYEYDSAGNLIKMSVERTSGSNITYYTYKTINLFFHVCKNFFMGK